MKRYLPLAQVGIVLFVVGFLPRTTHLDAQENDIQLTPAEVLFLMTAAAEAVDDPRLAAAVVDRGGRILGVYARPGASASTPDTAVTTARGAAMFSNAQAPLSARTVRFISGIHFPAGVPNTPNAALYGIENTNRGCQLNAADTAPIERPRSIAGSGLAGPRLSCSSLDQSGCARGGPIAVPPGASSAAPNGATATSVGFSLGKQDALDASTGPEAVSVNPGGFAVYRNGRVVGAVGVAGVAPDVAEFAAFAGVAGGAATGLSPLPANPLPVPGAVFIDGLRLPFFGTCTSVQCVLDTLSRGLPGVNRGAFSASDIRVQPRAGVALPEGYLIPPRDSLTPGGLTATEVAQIITQAVARADVTRAAIRLPAGQTTRMIIAVSDEAGEILGAFRMSDATVFSFDVATAKARNAYYFSSRPGYDVLRAAAVSRGYRWDPEPPAGAGWALTNRTLSFGGQPLFPPGIDLKKTPTPGPFFDVFAYDLLNPCTEGPGSTRGGNRQYGNQSGIVWFPGSAPLYKSSRLVGGVGVSGDGVEQDDYVTAGAVRGFDAPAALRVDRSVIRTTDRASVRLPYWKFPRNPEVR